MPSQIKERPIIFSGPMIKAILNGQKTQSRRVIKPQPGLYHCMHRFNRFVRWKDVIDIKWPEGRHHLSARCPYGQPGDQEWQSGMPPADGMYYVESFDRPIYLHRFLPENYPGEDVQPGLLWGWNELDDPESIKIEGLTLDTIRWKRPGDRLWVRETWATDREDDELKPSELLETADLWWLADHSSHRRITARMGKVRPSIHMPHWASRITLEITGVKVERVQDISMHDAFLEGADPLYSDFHDGSHCIGWFKRLWDSINVKRGFGWKVNPWVWCISLRRIEP